MSKNPRGAREFSRNTFHLFNLGELSHSRWSRMSARTVLWTRTSPSGRFPRSAFNFSLRTSISPEASWKYVAAPRYTIFTGRAQRSASRKTGHRRRWYNTSQLRPLWVSTIYNHHPTSRPVRRNLMAMLEWKVKNESLHFWFFFFFFKRKEKKKKKVWKRFL